MGGADASCRIPSWCLGQRPAQAGDAGTHLRGESYQPALERQDLKPLSLKSHKMMVWTLEIQGERRVYEFPLGALANYHKIRGSKQRKVTIFFKF